MANSWKSSLLHLYDRSPKDNFHSLARRLSPPGSRAAPLAVPGPPVEPQNRVIPLIWNTPSFCRLIAARIPPACEPLMLLGAEADTGPVQSALAAVGRPAAACLWEWSEPLPVEHLAGGGCFLLCRVPVDGPQWSALLALRAQFAGRVIALHELILPASVLQKCRLAFQYHKKSLEELVPIYLGERNFGDIDRLNEVFPLAGKTVIEFGPMDGYQTAGLLHAGAGSVTCIEARAENLIKTLVAAYTFGWRNVQLIMDDMHNADSNKYGKFDLAFAHGVYYHSNAPFVFLENLISLADAIFLGGYCATEALPAGDFDTLEWKGERYRVKQYEEWQGYSGGVNPVGYYFHKDDLQRFFRLRGFSVTVIADEASQVTAGNYLRFLAAHPARRRFAAPQPAPHA